MLVFNATKRVNPGPKPGKIFQDFQHDIAEIKESTD